MDVEYLLLRSGQRYGLLRSEGGEREAIVVGRGLSMRLHIVTYLREVGELSGPDGPAAVAALKQGWRTGSLPV